MKLSTCTFALFGAAALCSCATMAHAASPAAASPPSAQTSAFADTSWSPTVEAILAASKAARGGAAWDQVHSIRTKAALKLGGLTGTSTSLQDLRTGRSVRHTTLGPRTIAQGYDGKVGWVQRTGRKATARRAPAAKRQAASRAYQVEKAWWYPHRWPAKIQLIGKKQAHGKTFDVLQVTPRGGNAFKMWINAKTYLTARIVNTTVVGGTSTIHLSDYRTVEGVKIPFHRVVIGQAKIVAQLEKVALNVPVSSEDFALPGQHHDGIAIIGGKNKVTIPFKLVGGHIYLPVTVNGTKLGFVLDSGAGVGVLSPRAAQLVGLTSNGSFSAQIGAGSNTSSTGLVKAKRLVLGGQIKVANPTFLVTKMPEAPGKNHLDGLLGPGIYRHFVIRIDYVGHTVTFMTHKAFNPSNAGTPVPIKVFAGVPLADGSIDGLQGLFMVDTGFFGSLTLYSPFSKTHHLYSRYQSVLPLVQHGGGLGGIAKVRVARAGRLMIGSVAVHNPVVNLSLATKGTFASKGIAGDIGRRILKRFTVTFDFADKRMYLKPNKFYGMPMKQSWVLVTAGMAAEKTKHGYTVSHIRKGGPASQAGIEVGDSITAVNGKPAGKVSVASFFTKVLHGTPGTQVKLGVGVGEGKAGHTVTITLHRLIPKTGGLAPKSSSTSS